MSSVLAIMFQLLFILILLVFLGEPIRVVLSRRIKLLQDFDLIEAIIMDVYFGGIILYVLAILPFGLFSYPALIILSGICFVASIVFHLKGIRTWLNSNKRVHFVINKRKFLIYFLVIAIFIVFLTINVSSVSSLVYGTVRDDSIHSLYTQVILEQHQIPLTLQPYLPEGIVYCQGSHAIFAYATYALNLDIPQIILYVTVLFKAIIVLGAYFLGKRLGKSSLFGVGLSFVFAFISYWPLNIYWGANPFIVGFPLFLVCLGLLYSSRRKSDLADVVFLAILIGYSGSLILSFLETLIVVIAFLFIYYLIMSRAGRLRALGNIAIIVLISLLIISPFIYRFILFYPYPYHNILPSDYTIDTTDNYAFTMPLTWAFQNLSPYPAISAFIISILVCFFILICVTKDIFKIDDPVIEGCRFSFIILISALALVAATLIIPAGSGFNIISWGHQGIIISASISVFITSFFWKIYEHLNKRKWKFSNLKSSTPLIVSILIISSFIAPFMYYRLASDTQYVNSQYALYAVTTQDDYELLHWMRDNPDLIGANILVHPYSAGRFIPSVSHLNTTFPYTQSELSSHYKELIILLSAKVLNQTTYDCMRYLNVNYIYVGSSMDVNNPRMEPAYSRLYTKWDPELFLNNGNFSEVKNFGSSYLFKIEIN